jgi:hypothetical protein
MRVSLHRVKEQIESSHPEKASQLKEIIRHLTHTELLAKETLK